MIDQISLALFIRVASLGAIAKAGREFGLSATAATQRIQSLEAQLGARLFNRTTRSVALTVDGEVFLRHAKRIVACIEDARSDLQSGTRKVRGELRVTTSASFGRRYVAPHIAEFLLQYPELAVRLDLTDNIVDIVEQGFDVALRIGVLRPSSLVARKLANNPRLLVASPNYLRRCGTPEQPEDLSRHNCIVLGDTRAWTLMTPTGIEHEIRVSGNFTSNYGEAITEAVLGGAGIALKSRWDIQPQLTEGSLIPVLADCAIKPQWSVWAVRPPGPMVPARVRSFLEFMEKKFKLLPGRT